MELYEKNEEILINKMYTGSYTDNNIGHEIINFFKSDGKDGKSYIYAMPYGGIAKKHKVRWIFLTGAKETLKINDDVYPVLEVLALRKVKKQIFNKGDFHKRKKDENEEHYEKFMEKWKQYSQKQKELDIKYGGVEISKIFDDNEGNDTAIYVTFEVGDDIFIPSNNMYLVGTKGKKAIQYGKNKDGNIYIPINKKEIPSSSCKSFIEDNEDIDIVTRIIKNERYWEKASAQNVSIEENNTQEEESIFEIMGKQNDEISYSNMLYYFFNKQNMFNEFIKYINESSIIDDYNLEKEKYIKVDEKIGRMDIVAYGKENIVIIENKIKSNLNGKQKNGISQITKYYEALKEKEKREKKRTIKMLIFVPNYKKKIIENELQKEEKACIDIKEKWKIVTYKELYDFFKTTNYNKKDYKYKEFLKAIQIHTYDSYSKKIEEEMLKRFKSKIAVVK